MNKDIMQLNCQEFKQLLSEVTTGQNIYDNAGDIYGYLTKLFNQNANDSLLREWAFEWATCDKLDMQYDQIYYKWLALSK